MDLGSRGQSSTAMYRLEPATKQSYRPGFVITVKVTEVTRPSYARRINGDFAVPRDTGDVETSGYARWLPQTKSSEQAARFRIARSDPTTLRAIIGLRWARAAVPTESTVGIYRGARPCLVQPDTRCLGRPLRSWTDSDDVPKKCITNPPGYHRYPVVRRPPTTNAVLPRLALRTLRT